MTYPLINGAGINEEEDEGLVMFGLDLASSGTAEMVEVLVAGGDSPLQPGTLILNFEIAPEGTDMVSSGTHEGLFNALIQPAGIELVSAGTALASVAHFVSGYNPLELGANRPQLGTDFAINVAGIELANAGIATANNGNTPPAIDLEVASMRPLSLGAPGIDLGTITVDVGSSTPMQMGAPALTMGMLANGANALQMGAPGAVGQVVEVQSAQPLELGVPPVLAFGARAYGLDIGRQGMHSTTVAPVEVFMEGSNPLELGETGMPSIALNARPSFPLQLGQPLANRGATC